ncbi:hypothetical protein M406DRAFT_71440 [Cryphonectria parasitica EP155]|uniref:Uncharacterized protein n=1 Tax=Cryphonectria parasitica (strain ATCC 38755 / EP155) TaxID=660469 RepID=A0A9P4Y8J5_CRYP1|nr:uncharacterized protein M406DRAFT_71440 [Cryphonectria parasitica EP155]KAF3768430.1 hypothetical protein M406DRAFT_71440 [Cryphonectria parasitica EP155]
MNLQQTFLIASALALTAFSPELYHFGPEKVFACVFEEPIMQLQKSLKQKRFAWKVQHDFEGIAVFLINPPTAGVRVLRLGGTSPENTLQFLSDLQHEIGLTTMPFREYFDVVVANDLDIFFILTLFLEQWSQSDCRYHLPRLRSPRYTRKRLVSFGRNLDWDLKKVKFFNGTNAVKMGYHKIYSNFLPVSGPSEAHYEEVAYHVFKVEDF